MTWAIIENGVVANVIVADEKFIATAFLDAVRIDTCDPQPGIGWSYDGSTFLSPVSINAAPISGTAGKRLPPTAIVATGGAGGYAFTAENLPAAISISAGGVLSGTPKATGVFPITIRCVDSAGRVASAITVLSVQ